MRHDVTGATEPEARLMKCRHQTIHYLVNVVEFRSFLRPIAVTLGVSFLGESRQHYHDNATLLPDQLPEVRGGVRQRSLRGDVGGAPGVMIRLAHKQSQVSNTNTTKSRP